MSSADWTRQLAEDLGFKVKADNQTVALRHSGSPLTVRMEFQSDGAVIVYAICRTSSWDWHGERTDLNDVLSLFTAASLSCTGVASCNLVEIPHPAVDIPGELYARFLVFDQPYGSIIRDRDNAQQSIENLLVSITMTEHHMPLALGLAPHPDDVPDEVFTTDNTRLHTWASQIANALGRDANQDLAYRRWHPDWQYYRTVDGDISVIECEPLADYLDTLHATCLDKWQVLKGVDADLHLTSTHRHAVPHEAHRHISMLLEALNEPDARNPRVIPGENFLLASGGNQVVAWFGATGRAAYDVETENVRLRHAREAELLFPVSSFQWAKRIDDQQFELLVTELLTREPGVAWVRAVGPARDRDRGRDAIIDWTVHVTDEDLLRDEVPVETRRIVGQFKAYTTTVGKAKVKDIHDTLQHHQAGGYFLAVASTISSDLVDYLEALSRRHGYYVEWWTRTEIETRLRRNPDIAKRYRTVVWAV